MSATTPASRDGHEEYPGRIMSGETAQQSAVLRRILDEGAPRIREVAAAIAAKMPDGPPSAGGGPGRRRGAAAGMLPDLAVRILAGRTRRVPSPPATASRSA